MDNLGTDSGGFPVNGVPAATIYASFKAARKAGVQAFWLETPYGRRRATTPAARRSRRRSSLTFRERHDRAL